MRIVWVLLSACLSSASLHAQEAGGISSSVLSRCAGKAGGEVRQGDPAFVALGLDGRPWMTVERTESAVGSQPISTTVTGTGWRQRRGGTSVHFRFTCVLDERGQAVMFHASSLLRALGDRLPPSIVIDGAATFAMEAPLPRGVELQVQLLDPSQPPTARILAEQVVRSGWIAPIAFALRLPTDTALGDRTVTISARVVQAHQTLFEGQRVLTAGDLHRFVDLRLAKPADHLGR
jgi:hypothetical protein